MIRLTVCLSAAMCIQGCAYLTTYQTDIGTPTTGVSMDAKQRVVLVNKVSNQRRVCAEPSPDALSALGASLGASVVTDAGAAKQLAAALGESSASIGLRTTSIQLMRDSMYRACEAYLSGGISNKDYAELQAHFQTLTVGLLAIEQLTGAVQAQQVAITTDSAAGGGSDTTGEAERLIDEKKKTLAQKQLSDEAADRKTKTAKDLADKEAAVATAKTDAATKGDKLKKLQGELDALKKAGSDATAKEAEVAEAKTASDSAEKTVVSLQADAVELKKTAIAAERDAQNQESLLAIQKQAESIAQQAFDLARTRVRSTVRGDAKFGQQTRGHMSDATAASVASAIQGIVTTVVGVSIESRECIKVMSSNLSHLQPSQLEALRVMCDALAASETARAEVLRAQIKR